MDEEKIVGLLEAMMEKKFGHLFVDREQHHRDHLIVSEIDTSLLEFMKAFQSVVISARTCGISTIIKIVIPGIFALILGGLVLWFKTPIKNMFH